MNTSNKRNFRDRRDSNKSDGFRSSNENRPYRSENTSGKARVVKSKSSSRSEDDDFKPERRKFSGSEDKKSFRNPAGPRRTRITKGKPSSRPERDDFKTERKSFSNDTDRKPFRSENGSGRVRVVKRNDSSRFEENKIEGERRSYSQDRERRPSFSKSSDKPVIKVSARKKADDGLVRLNKIIASSGICSRREADDMIVAGLVSVNGKVVTELGSKVSPEDEVKYNGERLRKERMVYILLNKPKDYVTTLKDPYAKRTVLELIEGACKERVYPVGRLDRNTTGVLLLTNDGDLTKKLSHPSYNRKKVYHVYLDQNLKQTDLEAILNGMELEDGFIKADELSFVDPVDKKQIGIEIHSGRNRIVRRIFERLNYKVMKLDRVYFSGLTKKGLQRGHWRFLTNQEIAMLKMGSYE